MNVRTIFTVRVVLFLAAFTVLGFWYAQEPGGQAQETSNLTISITDDPDPVAPGGKVTYTIVVENSGSEDEAGVVVEDTLSGVGTIQSAVPSQGFCGVVTTTFVRCSLGTISAGGTATIQVIKEASVEPKTAMSLRVPASQTVECPSGPVVGEVCIVADSFFDVFVVADEIPSGGYILAQAWIDYGSLLTDKQNIQARWPDIEPATFLTSKDPTNNGLAVGGLTQLLPPQPQSNHLGDLFSFSLTCTTTPSSNTLSILAFGDPIAGTSGALFKEFGTNTEIVPNVSGITVNCVPPPIPRMSKSPALQNVFLTRQGAKIPPGSCLATKGTTANVAELAEGLNQSVVSPDPKDPSLIQQLAAFEFEVHYDNTKVCIDINVGASFAAAGAVCIVEDDQPSSKPQLEGVARIGCVTIAKGHNIDSTATLASVDVYPQPDLYSEMKPNQDNGNVVHIANVNCDSGDEQGHAIPLFSCDDADITFRYLEGDVEPDCVVDARDAQAISFRWGVEKGNLIYNDFMNLEPSSQQQDNDIDINDLQFVFGRFGSTCGAPHPPQPPVNPKA